MCSGIIPAVDARDGLKSKGTTSRLHPISSGQQIVIDIGIPISEKIITISLTMEPLLNVLIANLRYTAAALRGPLASELQDELFHSKNLPNKKLTALAGEAENLLDEIGLLIQPSVELLS